MKMPRYNNDTFHRWVASFVQGVFVLVILLLVAANIVNADFNTEFEIKQQDSPQNVPIYDQASKTIRK